MKALRTPPARSLVYGLLLGIVGLICGCQSAHEQDVFSPLPANVTEEARTDDLYTHCMLPGEEVQVNPVTVDARQPSAPGLTNIPPVSDTFAVGDLIFLKFSGTNVPIPLYQGRVEADGTFTLPLIGAVKATGKTPGELLKEIHERYVPRYYKHLTVLPSGIQPVYYIGGQVRQPGRQAYLGITTVTKAIESAGGFTGYTKGTRVELTRSDGKRFILNCVKAAKDPSLDLPVYPGDRISVPMQWTPDIFR